MAYLEKLFQIKNIEQKIATLEKSATFKEVALYLKNLASQITVIDIDLLRAYFNSDWNQSNDDIKHDLHWTIGYREKHKGDKSGIEKWIVIGGIGVGIAGVIGGAVLAWLSKGG
jgi:hypothetical protein